MDNSEENLMASKTDEELEDHIRNPKKYGPFEVAYSVAEMRKRGTFDERKFPRVVEAIRKKILPSYYSPDAIMACSFFWPILFSTILFAMNVDNQRDKWVVIGGGITFSIFIVVMNATFELDDRWYIYFKGFACFMLVHPVWNKLICENDWYVKKSIWPPVVIAVAVFALKWYLSSLYGEASVLFFL